MTCTKSTAIALMLVQTEMSKQFNEKTLCVRPFPMCWNIIDMHLAGNSNSMSIAMGYVHLQLAVLGD